jgi:DNA polymerase-3 subunit delta'
VLLIEDADRMLERTGNVLLKALEEPPPHTVWVLTAPSPRDVLLTVRSRCRQVALGLPPLGSVVKVLREAGVDPEPARLAALAAQCHIGLARHLATNPEAAAWRRAVLRLPAQLGGVSVAAIAAGQLDEAAKAHADAVMKERTGVERERLLDQMGEASRSRMSSFGRARLKQFDEESKRRFRRQQIDTLDRALGYLLAFYRDVLVVQFGARVDLVNLDVAGLVEAVARSFSVEQTMVCISAVEEARARVAGNVAPALALEAMAVALAVPSRVAANMTRV